MSDTLWILERRDPTRNMARYYLVAIEPTLFGDTALLRQWGRIGTQGRHRRDLYRNEALAQEALNSWLRRKTNRGYCLRSPSQSTPSDAQASIDPLLSADNEIGCPLRWK